MFDFLTQNRELKEQNMTLKADLEWNKFLCREADDLNSILKKVLAKKNNKIAELEKRVADLEDQLAKKVLLLDDEGTPIKSFTLTGKLIMLKESAEEKLEVGKWYHTTDFTKEKLTELLPKGTSVEVEREALYDNIEKEPPTKTTTSKVLAITEGLSDKDPLINIGSLFNKEWFKIIEE